MQALLRMDEPLPGKIEIRKWKLENREGKP
jgi:hypothetical protein